MTTDTAQPTDYLDRLTREYDLHIDAIEEVVQRAKNDGDRTLSAEEDAECKTHDEAAEKLLPQIQRWRKLRETRQKAVEVRDGAPPAQTVQRIRITERTDGQDDDADPDVAGLRRIHRSAGHFLRDRVLAKHNGDHAAAERVQRALAKVLTSDTPGLLPTPFVGDLLGRITAVRPLVNSSRSVPLPESGMTWKRPRITQHTSVDKQNTEKTEVASRKLIVGSLDVALETFAGAVNMSIQDIERSDPSALDIVFADLAAQYGKRTELAASEALIAGTETSADVPLAADADADDFREALFAAAGLIYQATDGEMPNRVIASIDQWSRIGRFARAINPQDRDVTGSPGSLDLTIAGLKVTVGPSLPAGSLLVGAGDYFETTETPGAPVELKALEVGILGYEVGVYGMFAAKVVEPGAFVNLTATP